MPLAKRPLGALGPVSVQGLGCMGLTWCVRARARARARAASVEAQAGRRRARHRVCSRLRRRALAHINGRLRLRRAAKCVAAARRVQAAGAVTRTRRAARASGARGQLLAQPSRRSVAPDGSFPDASFGARSAGRIALR